MTSDDSDADREKAQQIAIGYENGMAHAPARSGGWCRLLFFRLRSGGSAV